MNDALNEMMTRMTVKDLQRARASSERARDKELVAVLSERLSSIMSSAGAARS
jgi:hypothetical protein